MSWRNAHCLVTLRDQINTRFPARNKASDGTIGDTNHCPGSSDHCPKALDGSDVEVVTAMDITHDPASGCDGHSIVNALVASRDPRIKYIIWNSRIINSSVHPWIWRAYSGSNPHNKHFHLSVKGEKSLFDSTEPWQMNQGMAPPPSPPSGLGARFRVTARSGLRLREGPGTDFDIIGRMSPGEIVFVDDTEGDWYLVDRNGDGLRDGFAYGAYLTRM